MMTTREYDVFISYASEDRVEAKQLHDLLENADWKTFLSDVDLSKDLGKSQWSRKIDETLDKSGIVLVLISPNSLKSKWVEYEWRSTHANILRGEAGLIIPCCIKSIGPDQLGRALRRYQCVDLRNPATRAAEFSKLRDLIGGYLESPVERKQRKHKVRLLSLEGDGTRVLISAQIIQCLERKLHEHSGGEKKISDVFDIITGTSTGGVLALLLAHPEFTATEAITKLKDGLQTILKANSFPKNLVNTYNYQHAKGVLESIFGKVRVSDLSTTCLIPVYDLIGNEPLLLGHHKPSLGKEHYSQPDLSVASLALASISAPLTLHPKSITLNGEEVMLVDGGIYANNPSQIAYDEAIDKAVLKPLPNELYLLSLANGRGQPSSSTPKPWQMLGWLKRTMSIAVNSNVDLVHRYFLRRYESLGIPDQYLRISPAVSNNATFIRYNDNSPKSIDRLIATGNHLADQYNEELEEFIQLCL